MAFSLEPLKFLRRESHSAEHSFNVLSLTNVQSYGIADRLLEEGNHIYLSSFYDPTPEGGIAVCLSLGINSFSSLTFIIFYSDRIGLGK